MKRFNVQGSTFKVIQEIVVDGRPGALFNRFNAQGSTYKVCGSRFSTLNIEH
jgi:hypothetical protein